MKGPEGLRVKVVKTHRISWTLLRISTRIVVRQPMLALTSLLASCALLICFGLIFFILDDLGTFYRIEHFQPLTMPEIVAVIMFYAATVGVAVYFNAVLVASASDSLTGAQPSLASAFEPANDRVEALLGWTSIAATI